MLLPLFKWEQSKRDARATGAFETSDPRGGRLPRHPAAGATATGENTLISP